MTISIQKQAFYAVFQKTGSAFVDAISHSSPLKSNPYIGPMKQMALTMQVIIESYGFSFSKDLIIRLSHMDQKEIEIFWSAILPNVSQAVGAHRQFTPLYTNFPKQVISIDETELLVNALMHYAGDWLGLRILPMYTAQVRLPLIDKNKPKIIDAFSNNESVELFQRMLKSNVAMSPADEIHLQTMFDFLSLTGDAEQLIINADIPQKENLAFIGNMILNSNLDFNQVISHQFKTPTDILRLTAAMFKGDRSLAQNTKNGKISRAMRKAIMAKLETQLSSSNDAEQLVENFFSYKEKWVRLFHVLHIGEYKEKLPLLWKVATDLRSNNYPETFMGKAEKLFASDDLSQIVPLLSGRPGVFGRSLNRLLSLAGSAKIKQDFVLGEFKKIVTKIATPVLLQIHGHYLNQGEAVDRVFMPKGGLSSIFIQENSAQHVSDIVSLSVVEICQDALVSRFSSLSNLGNVWIDPALRLMNVPFAQRSASKALNTVARGSRFETMNKDDSILRLFLWWNENGIDKNGKTTRAGRTDIDLSCVILDENFKTVKVCSYYDMRSKSYGLTHSGDITSAPNGACEFIDIDLNSVNNGRYIGMLVNSFTGQPYSEVPECFAGWMSRPDGDSGEIFDARTVKNKIDLTSQSKMAMPGIFDLQTRQFIWTDLSIKSMDGYSNNVGNNNAAITMSVKALATMKKPNLFDLFEMHALARGTIVKNKSKADTVFSLNDGVTPYMFDVIASDYMAN